MTRHVLIASMKDEGPFVLEWVAHHLVMGFDAIYIASNDCRDGTDRMLAALDRLGYITHVPHIVPKDVPPIHAGYDAIRAAHDLDGADWLTAVDADEFLNVHIGAHRIQDLTNAAPQDVDIITLNGMVFADTPQVNWQAGRVCDQFQSRIALRHKANGAIKSTTRDPGRFAKMNSHHMVDFQGAQPITVMRGDGKTQKLDPDLPLYRQIRYMGVHKNCHNLAQYNHYAIRTWDSFRVRRDRGRGGIANENPDQRRYTEAYFAARNQPDAQEASIARYAPQVIAQMEQMLTHGKIRRHQALVEMEYAALCAPYRRPIAHE